MNQQPECIHPSLASGKFHVVIAAHKRAEWSSHYVWLSALTNSTYFIYCREKLCTPLRSGQGFCNVQWEERLLLPNVGRDAAVFFHYALSVYDNPPSALAFLHGHVAKSRHNSCGSVYGRLHSYYNGIAGADVPYFQAKMISLNDRNWFGRKEPVVQNQRCGRRSLLKWTIRQMERRYGNRIDGECRSILANWNITLLERPYYHCCASFAMPGKRLLSYPRGFYEEMLQYHLKQRLDQLTSRTCFEFLVYHLLGDELTCDELRELDLYYREADKLYKSTENGKQFHQSCRSWKGSG